MRQCARCGADLAAGWSHIQKGETCITVKGVSIIESAFPGGYLHSMKMLDGYQQAEKIAGSVTAHFTPGPAFASLFGNYAGDLLREEWVREFSLPIDLDREFGEHPPRIFHEGP